MIYNSPKSLSLKLSNYFLKKVEQVGFVNLEKKLLKMMGGELCINATLAFASTFKKNGTLFTSGVNTPVRYKNKQNKTTIRLKLNYKKIKNIILFDGIGYICIKENKSYKISKKISKNLAKEYNLPAFGIILYKRNKITPYIYVREIDSFVKETACGSGSIAFSIFSKNEKIIQPTNEIISVTVNNTIEVSAEVENVIKETLLNKDELNKL